MVCTVLCEYFCIFRNSNFHQSQDSEDMKTKSQTLTSGDTHENDNFISENKLFAQNKTLNRQLGQNKENECDKKLHTRDSGNVISVEEEQISKLDSDIAKLTQGGKPVKHPLHRKSSNITNDSGRSTVSDIGENENDLSEGEGHQCYHINQINGLDPLRRESLTVIDSTGHLALPSPIECLSVKPFHEEDADTFCENSSIPGKNTLLAHSTHNSIDSQTSSPGNSRPGSSHLSLRHAPRILYSNSEDSTLTQRRLSYPRSPLSSPSTSPRLRRQPTMETRRISLSDSGDGYIQLNQYRLKDEIGKVSLSIYPCKSASEPKFPFTVILSQKLTRNVDVMTESDGLCLSGCNHSHLTRTAIFSVYQNMKKPKVLLSYN